MWAASWWYGYERSQILSTFTPGNDDACSDRYSTTGSETSVFTIADENGTALSCSRTLARMSLRFMFRTRERRM